MTTDNRWPACVTPERAAKAARRVIAGMGEPAPRTTADMFEAALAEHDAEAYPHLPEAEKLLRRALVAAMWFVENITDDDPDRQDIFFRVREMSREGFNA